MKKSDLLDEVLDSRLFSIRVTDDLSEVLNFILQTQDSLKWKTMKGH